MKKTLYILLIILTLVSCDDDSKINSESHSVDVECKNKSNGWHTAEYKNKNKQGDSYTAIAEWHCQNQYLSISDDTSFGRLLVEQRLNNAKQINLFRYTLIQTEDALQKMVVQALDQNAQDKGVIRSYHADLNFATVEGLYPQLFDISNLAQSSYFLTYDINSQDVVELAKVQLHGNQDNIYTLDYSKCNETPFISNEWQCDTWQYQVNAQKKPISKSQQTKHTHQVTLVPKLEQLHDAINVNTEIERLATQLGLQ